MLAIVFALTRFHHNTYGRHGIVESDHKPLESITKKPVSTESPRIKSMLLKSQHDYTVKYVSGKRWQFLTCSPDHPCQDKKYRNYTSASDIKYTCQLVDSTRSKSQHTLIRYSRNPHTKSWSNGLSTAKAAQPIFISSGISVTREQCMKVLSWKAIAQSSPKHVNQKFFARHTQDIKEYRNADLATDRQFTGAELIKTLRTCWFCASTSCTCSCFLNCNSCFLTPMSCSALSFRNSTVSLPLLLHFFALLCPSSDFLFCVLPIVSIAVLRISSAFSLFPSILSCFSPSSRSCCLAADSSMAIICSMATSTSVFVGFVPLSFNSLA